MRAGSVFNFSIFIGTPGYSQITLLGLLPDLDAKLTLLEFLLGSALKIILLLNGLSNKSFLGLFPYICFDFLRFFLGENPGVNSSIKELVDSFLIFETLKWLASNLLGPGVNFWGDNCG